MSVACIHPDLFFCHSEVCDISATLITLVCLTSAVLSDPCVRSAAFFKRLVVFFTWTSVSFSLGGSFSSSHLLLMLCGRKAWHQSHAGSLMTYVLQHTEPAGGDWEPLYRSEDA